MNTTDITAQANNISLDTEALNQNRLCEIWPIVKEGLGILANVIKNPFVKLTINGIIAAGDAIMGQICGSASAKSKKTAS